MNTALYEKKKAVREIKIIKKNFKWARSEHQPVTNTDPQQFKNKKKRKNEKIFRLFLLVIW